MIDYVEIHGYKSIKDQRIELKSINILLGANGSGKSNFLSFFKFLNRLCTERLDAHLVMSGGEDKFLHHGKQMTDALSFSIEWDGCYGYAARLQSTVYGFVLTDESFKKGIEGQKGCSVWTPLISSGSVTKKAQLKGMGTEGRLAAQYLENIIKYHFRNTGNLAAFTKMSNIETDIHYLYEEGDNLAAYLYHIRQKDPKTYKHIVFIIQSIAPYFSDFILQPNENNWVSLQWKDKYSDMIYGAYDLSDGAIRFIALATLFLQPKLPAVLVVDEPELGLHPDAISKLAGMIRSAAARGCQVIVATQSADLMSEFKPDDIITVDTVNGETLFQRLTSKQLDYWLENYTIDDLWKRSVIPSGQVYYNPLFSCV